MAWTVELGETAKKELAKLDRTVQIEIYRYLQDRIATKEDPPRFGAPLKKDLAGLWKYRVKAYRLICEIQDDKVLVLVIRIGHRKNVYGGH